MSYLERLTANNSALETILEKVLEYNESIVTFDPTEHITYTGQKTVIDDGDGNWRVKFLSSGQVTFIEDPGPIDVFCVGGGGGGGCYGVGGGGGGYTTLESNVKLTNFINDVTIGAGGTSFTLPYPSPPFLFPKNVKGDYGDRTHDLLFTRQMLYH